MPSGVAQLARLFLNRKPCRSRLQATAASYSTDTPSWLRRNPRFEDLIAIEDDGEAPKFTRNSQIETLRRGAPVCFHAISANLTWSAIESCICHLLHALAHTVPNVHGDCSRANHLFCEQGQATKISPDCRDKQVFALSISCSTHVCRRIQDKANSPGALEFFLEARPIVRGTVLIYQILSAPTRRHAESNKHGCA